MDNLAYTTTYTENALIEIELASIFEPNDQEEPNDYRLFQSDN